MNSTPHTPEPSNQTQPEDSSSRPAKCWMSERLDNGAERYWTDLGRPYSGGQEDRARLTEAMAAIRWYRNGEAMPFSPGMLLKEIIRASGIKPMALGISDIPVEFPEPDLLDRDRDELEPWQFQTCSTVAICWRHQRDVFVTHFLDLGLEATTIAYDLREVTRPQHRAAPSPAPPDSTEPAVDASPRKGSTGSADASADAPPSGPASPPGADLTAPAPYR